MWMPIVVVVVVVVVVVGMLLPTLRGYGSSSYSHSFESHQVFVYPNVLAQLVKK